MRTRGINLTQGMEFRDKISRSLKFYGGWFSVLFVIAGRNAHAVTFSKWNIETTTGNMIYTFSYKLNIFLVIESKDLICIYYTDLIKIFMIHWREIVKYYAELEGNQQKLNTKKWRTRFDSGRVSNTLWRFLKFPSFDVNILKSSLLIYHRIHRQISLSFESIANFSWGLEIREMLFLFKARFHTRDFTPSYNALTNRHVCHLSDRVRTCTTAPDPIGTRVTTDQILVFTICLANWSRSVHLKLSVSYASLE